jgi:nitroreductase
MELRDVLTRRKMTRSYDQRPIPSEVLDRVLSVVRHAPTAGHSQGNEYLVLDSPEDTSVFWEMTDDPLDPLTPDERAAVPQVLVLPLANKRAYLARYSQPDKAIFGLGEESAWPVPYWDVDAGMAAMLLMLAAIDEGLACWFFGIDNGEQEMLSHFGVPEEFRLVGIVGMGYAAPLDPMTEQKASSGRLARRPVVDLLHRNRW